MHGPGDCTRGRSWHSDGARVPFLLLAHGQALPDRRTNSSPHQGRGVRWTEGSSSDLTLGRRGGGRYWGQGDKAS